MEFLKPKLYSLVLLLVAAVVITALGGGFFNQQGSWNSQWQHRMFQDLCHQIPERSFWVNDQPMAVCSRCFGIYSGFATGWLFLIPAAFSHKRMGFSFKKIILVALAVNAVDFVANALGIWENTLTSRLVMGLSIGLPAALFFVGDIIINHK